MEEVTMTSLGGQSSEWIGGWIFHDYTDEQIAEIHFDGTGTHTIDATTTTQLTINGK